MQPKIKLSLDNSLDKLKIDIERAVKASTPKIFIRALLKIIEKYYQDPLLISVRKSIIEMEPNGVKHFWEIEEQELLSKPISIDPESMILPVGTPTVGEIMFPELFEKFYDSIIPQNTEFWHMWLKLDFIYQVLKNHKKIKAEKLKNGERFIVSCLDNHFRILNNVLVSPKFAEQNKKDFDLEEHKDCLLNLLDYTEEYFSAAAYKGNARKRFMDSVLTRLQRLDCWIKACISLYYSIIPLKLIISVVVDKFHNMVSKISTFLTQFY